MGQLLVILKLEVAEIESKSIEPVVLVLVKVTVVVPLLLPTVMVPKLIEFGATV
jgi:hypothetical protein